MDILIRSIGRPMAPWLKNGYQEYIDRLERKWTVTIQESLAPKGSRIDGPTIKRLEAKILTDRLPARSTVIALDPNGKALSSEQLATVFGQCRDQGQSLVFLIGGAFGLDVSVRQMADRSLSLGALTLPHQLVKLVLAEAIYRSSTILAGHPYHKS